MHIHVLGAGAGGGFPQWNCNCQNCDGRTFVWSHFSMRYSTIPKKNSKNQSLPVKSNTNVKNTKKCIHQQFKKKQQ